MKCAWLCISTSRQGALLNEIVALTSKLHWFEIRLLRGERCLLPPTPCSRVNADPDTMTTIMGSSSSSSSSEPNKRYHQKSYLSTHNDTASILGETLGCFSQCLSTKVRLRGTACCTVLSAPSPYLDNQASEKASPRLLSYWQEGCTTSAKVRSAWMSVSPWSSVPSCTSLLSLILYIQL